MFDVSSFDTRTASEAGVAMEILHPKTGLPMMDAAGAKITITLMGPSSAKSIELNRQMALRRAEMAGRGITMSDADFDAERTQFLSAMTVGWTFDQMDGQAFTFTPDNAARFWADKRWVWLADRAWRSAQADGNFLAAS